jgi:hypothetical protein
MFEVVPKTDKRFFNIIFFFFSPKEKKILKKAKAKNVFLTLFYTPRGWITMH